MFFDTKQNYYFKITRVNSFEKGRAATIYIYIYRKELESSIRADDGDVEQEQVEGDDWYKSYSQGNV